MSCTFFCGRLTLAGTACQRCVLEPGAACPSHDESMMQCKYARRASAARRTRKASSRRGSSRSRKVCMTLPGSEDQIMDLAMDMVSGDATYRAMMAQHLASVQSTAPESFSSGESFHDAAGKSWVGTDRDPFVQPWKWDGYEVGYPEIPKGQEDKAWVRVNGRYIEIKPTSAIEMTPTTKSSYERAHCLDLPDAATCYSDPNCQWTERTNGTSFCGAKSGVRKLGADKVVYEGPLGKPLGF